MHASAVKEKSGYPPRKELEFISILPMNYVI
jgi:hypothetical protein